MGKKDSRKKKIKLGILAGLTSASVLLAGTFDSPKDVLDGHLDDPEPLREEYDQPIDNSLAYHVRTGFRNFIYMIPVRIRAILCIPLWFAGNGVLFLLELIYRGILTPMGNLIVSFLLQNLVLLAVIAAAVKLLFPDLPWSKIFNKKTIITVFIGSLIMSVCDLIMPMIWDRYRLYRTLSKLIIGLIVVVLVMTPFVKRRLKKIHTYDIEYDM